MAPTTLEQHTDYIFSMSFNSKVVLVTGGSSGIGAAIAIQFAEQGAKVAIVGRNESKLKTVSQKCEQSGSKPLVIVADVTKDDDVKRILRTTLEQYGKLDVLINNAGIIGPAEIVSAKAIETFDRIMATNLRSAVYLTNLAAPHLITTKGNVINISSIAAIGVMTPGSFAYCASKAGLDHFSRCIALELAPKGVRVNTVNPGPVKTDIMENMGYDVATQAKFIEVMKKSTALNRVADAEEVADLVLFLASNKAKGITGSSYVTDNGFLLKGAFVP